MSGDFPDDWFRPVEPTPPSDQSVPAPSSPDEPGTDPSGSGVLGSSTTSESTGRSSDTGSNPTQTNPSGISGTGVVDSGIRTTKTGSGTVTAESITSSGTGSGSLPRVEQPTPARGIPTGDPSDLDPGPPSGPEPGVIPVIAAPGALVVGRVEGAEPEAPTGSTLHPGVVVLVVVILSLAVGLVIGLLLVGARPTEPTPTPSVPTPTAAAPSALQPYTGAIKRVQATQVSAACTSAPKPDAQGNLVSYEPDMVLDADPTTAWRCNGDGVGQAVSFTFAPGTKLVGVGVLNGYAKSSGADRYYDQFRRVLVVRWDMPNGTYFVQYLSDNNLSVQRVMIPSTPVDGKVTMTILESSESGVPDNPERDAVLVSSVEFWTAPA